MKKKDTDDDHQLFREMVGDVKPLTSDKVFHQQKKPKARVLTHTEENTGSYSPFSDAQVEQSVGSEEQLFFSRGGLQQKLLRNLKRGQITIEQTLDLHGLTSEQAQTTLQQFITHCQESGIRMACVIHGKGYRSEQHPVLKSKVAHWLPQHPAVLAFCSAQPRHGGAGAIYLLLKKL